MLRRRLIPVVLAFSLVALGAAVSYSEKYYKVVFRAGYLEGNSFRVLEPIEKTGYAMGFVDGIFMSPVFKASNEDLQWFETCVSEKSNAQIVDIFDKYLDENPTQWHLPMNSLAYSALAQDCRKMLFSPLE